MADTTSHTPPRTDEEKHQLTDPEVSERAKDKGKQIMVEPEHVELMDLKPEDLNKPLDVKVYRKWMSKNIPDPTPTGISFILLDRKVRSTIFLKSFATVVVKMIQTLDFRMLTIILMQGGAIQANGQLADTRQLDTRLQLDSCYRIQGFGAKKTDNWQRTLENKMTLLFGRFTQAAPIQGDGFPKHYFNFAPYNEVCHRADTREPILTSTKTELNLIT